MAKVPPPEHTRWKKGVSGNPTGGRKLPDDLRKVAPLTSEELRRTISKHFRFNKTQLAEVLSNPNAPTIDIIIASTIAHAMKHGDIQKAEYLFQRLIGRVTEKVEVQYPEPVVIERPSGEQLVLDVASDAEMADAAAEIEEATAREADS